jgi:hypothetical protein
VEENTENKKRGGGLEGGGEGKQEEEKEEEEKMEKEQNMKAVVAKVGYFCESKHQKRIYAYLSR